MPEFGFCGPSYQAQSPNIDAEDAMNCYCERSESEGAKTKMSLLHTPGLAKFAVLTGELSCPSLFTVNGRTFAAASNLWEVTPGGPINLGTLGAIPSQPPQITTNEAQLVISNNGNLFVLTLATNVLTAVNMGQFNGPIAQIGSVDGYIIATLQTSHTFQQSNLEDATTWSGLNIATLSYFPDNITSMICDHREVWFYSSKKAIGYYNGGAGFPVFIPIQGAFIENGCGAGFATCPIDNSVLWLDQDERGSMVARRLNGYKGDRISTHAVELAWQSYGTTSDAVGYCYQEEGHPFWIVYFPTANKTWAYDISTGFWHKRGKWNAQSGTYSAHQSMCHTFNFGAHLVGDPFSGTVYRMSSTIYTDDGHAIRGYRITPTISEENKRLYFNAIEFDLETGLAPIPALVDGNGQHRAPQLMLSWSNNAGKTWSQEYTLSAGLAGEYGLRVIKHMLGMGRRRIWKAVWTDPIPWRFANAFVTAQEED